MPHLSAITSRTVSRGLITACLAATLSVSISGASGEDALPSAQATLAEAQATAKSNRRLVLLEFKAWYCPFCKAFEKEILMNPDFQAFAGDHLELVIYDVARRSELNAEQREELDALMKTHRVQFTPTIVVFSPDGKVLLQSDELDEATAATFIAQLKGLSGHAEAPN